ncbi:MAG: polysaccharide deacetylase family protein [Clostridia bacterium]|nr:polysaccharide deacetylase family protein [Clostridia bacterium]
MSTTLKRISAFLALLMAVCMLAVSCADKLTVESTDGEQNGSSFGESGQSSPEDPSKEPILTPMPSESQGGQEATTPSGGSPSDSPTLSPTPSGDPTVVPTPSGEPTPTPTPTPSKEPSPTPPPSDDDPIEPTTLPYTPFHPTDKVVAFTFDDGPDKNTTNLLNILEGSEDKVTFFINGYYVDAGNYRPVIKRAYDMGHQFGLHTYSHKNLFAGGKDADEALISEEIGRIAKMYTEITGDTTFLLRPPGGNFNKTRNYGYSIIMWSVDSEDWIDAGDFYKGTATLEEAAQKTAARILKNVRSGDIVLMHDIHPTSIRAFEIARAQLKAEGYRFVTVTELLKIKAHEHTGQYFFSTARYGQQGVIHDASENQSAAVMTLMKKEELY